MRCPECERLERPHSFHKHKTQQVQGQPVAEFWDEKNRHHVHDHGVYRTRYHCDAGHQYDEETLSRCPVHDCDWNQQPLVSGIMRRSA